VHPHSLIELHVATGTSSGDGEDMRTTYAEGAGRISAEALLIGVKEDMLIPSAELKSLADIINKSRTRETAQFKEFSSIFGHDAFLKESELLGPMMREFLEAGLERQLADELVHNTDNSAP
jgi:homoserine acetyltransferase